MVNEEHRDEFERVVEEQRQRILRESRIHRKEEQDARKRFEATLQRTLKQPLGLFETIYLSLRGASETCIRMYGTSAVEQEDYVFQVYALICRRACHLTSAVQVLLETGHGTEALALWRTLYELMIVCTFIDKHGPALAERYYYHDSLESGDLLEYANTSITQGGIVSSQLALFREHKATLCVKYGDAFANKYGWAVGYLSNKERNKKSNTKPTFTQIEGEVSIPGIKLLKGWYQIANNSIHATQAGNTFNSEYFDRHDLSGHSPKTNLKEPAWLSLRSLLACVGYLLQHYDLDRSVPFLEANNRLIQEMIRSFPVSRVKEDQVMNDEQRPI